MITEENKLVEVFGTVEVSVKEFMGSSDKSLVLLSDYEKAKQNLLGLKEKHELRVAELVAIEKLSPSEFKELNEIRAELREPRYLLQKIETNNVSVFEAYKKNDKAKRKELIDINHSLEETASEKLKVEEQRKKDEKDAELKAEENRIDKIKTDIDNIETYCSEIVQKMTFENMKVSAESIDQSLNADYDFEEYDILFEQVKSRVAKLLLDKTNDITARENQRLDNERMKQEIFDGRVNRLKEVGFNINEKDVFVHKDLFAGIATESIYECTSSEFEQMLSDAKISIEKVEQDKRDSEIKREKDEQFKVRTNRLAEIGLLMEDYKDYFSSKEFATIKISGGNVYNATITEFEEILTNAKQSIIDAEKKKEADELAEQEKRKQEAIAQKKADAENKARVKRLAKDKAIYEQSLKDSLGRFPIVFESDQSEIKAFSIEASNKVTDLLNELLTQLNDL